MWLHNAYNHLHSTRTLKIACLLGVQHRQQNLLFLPWTFYCHCEKFLSTMPDVLTRIDGDNQVKQKRNVNLMREILQ